jgi:hypothetical protein
VRFLADENIPLPSIVALRRAGHDVASVLADMPRSSDTPMYAISVQ